MFDSGRKTCGVRALSLLMMFLGVPCVLGQISFDRSFSNNPRALSGNDIRIDWDDGRQAGGNSFYSFREFSIVDANGKVTFIDSRMGAEPFRNIFARVTGDSASTINGTLASEVPGANLFFMNPNGILFGGGARLDISGSFTATTANRSRFGDGFFTAVEGADVDMLPATDPTGFEFFGSPQPLSLDGSRLARCGTTERLCLSTSLP